MTPHHASKMAITFAISIFFIIFAFNLGRLTNNTVTVKDECGHTINHSIPFKGTLP
jgi:hypothetical protein